MSNDEDDWRYVPSTKVTEVLCPNCSSFDGTQMLDSLIGGAAFMECQTCYYEWDVTEDNEINT